MKIIKFRGKSKVLKTWMYGSLIVDGEKKYIVTKRISTGGLDEVIPKSVGQFIGLCDKNNKELYTGDIVVWISSWGEKIFGYIRYSERRARFYVDLLKGGIQTFYDFSREGDGTCFGWSDLEIIGNRTETFKIVIKTKTSKIVVKNKSHHSGFLTLTSN